jgi:plastocyanin
MSQAHWWYRAVAAAGLALMASCGGGGGNGGSSMPTEPQPSAKTVTVQIVDFAFSPRDVQINVGDTVQWVLASSTYTHTVTADDGSFSSGMTFNRTGATFSKTFNTDGVTVAYHCQTHWHTNGMQGAVQVGKASPPPPPGY